MPLMTPQLDLTLTAELRTECVAFLNRIAEYSPTLALLKATGTGDPIARWYYAAYRPDNLDTLIAEYERRGVALLHQVSGLTVAIPQIDLLGELQGKTLARGATGIEVRERDSGII
jgi:hypothetical protein